MRCDVCTNTDVATNEFSEFSDGLLQYHTHGTQFRPCYTTVKLCNCILQGYESIKSDSVDRHTSVHAIRTTKVSVSRTRPHKTRTRIRPRRIAFRFVWARQTFFPTKLKSCQLPFFKHFDMTLTLRIVMYIVSYLVDSALFREMDKKLYIYITTCQCYLLSKFSQQWT